MPKGLVKSEHNIDDWSDESDDELAFNARAELIPDTTRLERNDINLITRQASGTVNGCDRQNITSVIQKRVIRSNGFGVGERRGIRNRFLPNMPLFIEDYCSKVFCGLYSKDGKYFITATQDKWLHVYRTHDDRFEMFKQVQARDVGWSVLDIAFSPDGKYFAYSSWADCLYQCPISGNINSLETLSLSPGVRRFCVFSVAFSNDGREILGGANDKCLYVYDRECHQRVLRFEGHAGDVNTVAFADSSSQIFYSASDDGLCKVWDRRTVSETSPRAVGVLAGHRDGITYVDSRGDTRYLITNSKDQSIKLWDARVFSNRRAERNARQFIERQDWDYRWQPVPERIWEPGLLEGDTSVMTYYGHSVRKTLIRCRFSPADTTGQRYIYTGDSRGRLVIYDILTGKMVRHVKGHMGCIRDVSWHPFNHNLLTSSWDGRVAGWDYRDIDISENLVRNEEGTRQLYLPPIRRSERIAAQRGMRMTLM